MVPVQFDAAEALEVVRVLAAVAAADGAILAREEVLLEEFALEHGIGGHLWLTAPLDEAALAETLLDPEKRREVLRMCMRMALADGDFADAERAILARIARSLGIAGDELATLTGQR